MPLYDYIDSRDNSKVELFRTIEKRDAVPNYLRRIIPHSFALLRPSDPHQMAHDTQKTLATLEDRLGISELERQTGFDAKTLKKVWFDEAEKPNPNELVAADA